MINWPLEISKLLISVSVPAIIAYIGWKLNKRLKHIEQSQWEHRKIIEKRIEIYDEVVPNLNTMYCFCMWIGDWKEIDPDNLLSLKRITDKKINVYRYLLNDDLYRNYNDFVHSIFQTYNGAGEDAKIRAKISGPDGDRTKHYRGRWDPNWNSKFETESVVSKMDLTHKYNTLMQSFRSCLGLNDSKTK